MTVRDETEWVELVEAGANVLTGAQSDNIIAAFQQMQDRPIPADSLYGVGDSAGKIISALGSQEIRNSQV